jgi:hypothetical protein
MPPAPVSRSTVDASFCGATVMVVVATALSVSPSLTRTSMVRSPALGLSPSVCW